MAEYQYIHIALRGTVQGATRTIYSYPTDDDGLDPAWSTTMVEPSAAIKRFLNATECYVMQSTPIGNYISLITRNTMAPEKGFMMLSVMVDDGYALTGRQVVSLFANLKKALIEDEELTDQAVDLALIRAEVPRQGVELESWTYLAPEPSETPVAEAAYRTYMTVQELESIFSFPEQKEYQQYRCILVVSATISLRPGVKMPRITTPIRRQYTVEAPEGIEVSERLVYDGDRLEITYTKPGYDSHKETVTVGQLNAYTKTDGSKILIRTPQQTGIRFVRKIAFKVNSTKGTPLNGYTVSINGHTVNTMTPWLELTERELVPDGDVEIQVASTNYKTLKLTIPTSEMLTTEKLDFELQPVEQTVTLRLDFGGGRVFEQEVSIEKNTAEYNRLHSGNFHGFRAHRQVTDDNSEVYNIDVRLTNPPVAPNFETGHTDSKSDDSRRRLTPQFENISDEAGEKKPVIDTSLPVDPRREEKHVEAETNPDNDGPVIDDIDDDDDEYRSSLPFYRNRGFLWGLGALIVIAVVALAIFLPGDKGASDQLVTETTIGADSTAVAQTAPVAPMTPEEQADADYLNNNAAWDLSKLQSPMGQALAEAIKDGDLKALAENDYFAVTGRCTNARANEIVDMAWAAIGSPNEKGNKRRLSTAAKSGSIELKKAVEAMAKVRPSEEINTNPRPRK